MTTEPDEETIAVLVLLARELPDVDADEALQRLESLSAEQRAVVERAVTDVARREHQPRPERGYHREP